MPIVYAKAGSLEHVTPERMQELTEGNKYQWINPYTKMKEGNSWFNPLVQCNSCQERFRIVSCECGHTRIEATVIEGGQLLYVRHSGYRAQGLPPHLIDRWKCRCGKENLIGHELWVLDEKKGCFIATAVYGSVLQPEVLEFRNFRETILEKSILGRAFTKIYYLLSPPVASVIASSAFLKWLVKKLIISPLLSIVRFTKEKQNV